MIQITENKPIIIKENNTERQVSKEEFEKLNNDVNIKLKQIKENVFIVLHKLYS